VSSLSQREVFIEILNWRYGERGRDRLQIHDTVPAQILYPVHVTIYNVTSCFATCRDIKFVCVYMHVIFLNRYLPAGLPALNIIVSILDFSHLLKGELNEPQFKLSPPGSHGLK